MPLEKDQRSPDGVYLMAVVGYPTSGQGLVDDLSFLKEPLITKAVSFPGVEPLIKKMLTSIQCDQTVGGLCLGSLEANLTKQNVVL